MYTLQRQYTRVEFAMHSHQQSGKENEKRKKARFLSISG